MLSVRHAAMPRGIGVVVGARKIGPGILHKRLDVKSQKSRFSVPIDPDS